MNETIWHLIVSKMNVKSMLLFISLCLCIAGIYMCVSELKAVGEINMKSAVFEGKITTGSLGLLVVFLGIMVAWSAKQVSLKEKHVEINHGDLRVTAANMEEHEWEKIVGCLKEHEEHHTGREVLKHKSDMANNAIHSTASVAAAPSASSDG